MKECVLYKNLENKKVQCLACNHRCRILDGKTGICGVRQNQKGKLYLLVFGRAISANLDPIEKKPLYHFLPGSKIFSIGTVGCNFGCGFCQNFDISQITKNISSAPKDLRQKLNRGEWGYELSAAQIVDYCVQHKIPSLAFTYNEPTIFSEYAVEVMKMARKQNLYSVFVSNGFETKECLDYINPYIDAFNIDLKSFSDKYYQTICKARLEPVLATIKELHRRKKWLEVTTLLVPGKNDSKGEITGIAKFIKSVSPDIPWHISAFFPTYKMTELKATPAEKLYEAYEIGKKVGLNYIYTGNIPDFEKSQTVCPECRTLLVKRSGFGEADSKLKEGHCPQCGRIIPGVWRKK